MKRRKNTGKEALHDEASSLMKMRDVSSSHLERPLHDGGAQQAGLLEGLRLVGQDADGQGGLQLVGGFVGGG